MDSGGGSGGVVGRVLEKYECSCLMNLFGGLFEGFFPVGS